MAVATAGQRGKSLQSHLSRLHAELLTEALGRWRGPAFGDLADHPAIRPEAVRLERLRTAAAGELVDARLALGRPDEVVADLEAAVERDPLDERAHAQLMLARVRTGRQAEALATFRRLRDRLREELGVDPSPPVCDLHERILRHDPALAWHDDAGSSSIAAGMSRPVGAGRPPDPNPTEPVAGPRPHRGGGVELVGRDEDVAAISHLVDACPLVTLTGPGGERRDWRSKSPTCSHRPSRTGSPCAPCPACVIPPRSGVP